MKNEERISSILFVALQCNC